MCGIVGVLGKHEVGPILVEALKRLEYRGYDSAGISISSRKSLRTWKSAGKIATLESQLPDTIKASSGIGHTRWATHGAPTDVNAHPHMSDDASISVVHNGIIENVDALKKTLDVDYKSETDSELLAHLLSKTIKENECTLIDAMRDVLSRIVGTYGIAAMSTDFPDTRP